MQYRCFIHKAEAKDSKRFIGLPSLIGRGHGQAYLRLLAVRLYAEGAPAVAIDPAKGNLRARGAYEKAGFRVEARVMTEAGSATLMLYDQRARALAFVVAILAELAGEASSPHISDD